MAHNTPYLFLLIVLFGIVNDTFAVAVLSDENQLEPIKPSLVDKTLDELPNKKAPTKFNPSVVEIVSDNYAKRESTSAIKNEKLIEEDKMKKTRTHERLTERDKLQAILNCCSARFETSSGRLESTQTTTRSSDIHRFPDRYGNRPDDRFSWHSSSGRPGGSSSTNSGNGAYGNSGGTTDRRFALRPTYSNNNDGEYTRPGVSNNNRPTGSRPGYGYGYGGYGDNGAYGSQGFEVQRPGGIQFSGSGGRPPGGGYGIYGTLGEQDEFPGADGGGAVAPTLPNIQTQKAVALKALAGVALIGAAAALAANPALIPVGAVLAGRKRRSTKQSSQFNLLEFPEQFIRDRVPQILEDDQVAKNFWDSPECVARLACEVQREYVTAIRKDPKLRWDVHRRLRELIESDVLSADYVRQSMKMLTGIARDVKTNERQCEIFTCDLFTT